MPGSVTKLKVLSAMNRNYLENRRVEFCKTLYLLRYGTSEHPRALSFEATPFNHAQSVSVRYLELIFHVDLKLFIRAEIDLLPSVCYFN